jgi:hypothetical protein
MFPIQSTLHIFMNKSIPLIIQPFCQSDYALGPVGDGLASFSCTVATWQMFCHYDK